jgi:fructose-1,6-bisphosphatase I
MAISHPTLEKFLSPQKNEPQAQLLLTLANTAIELQQMLSTAPLAGLSGPSARTGNTNATGDEQKKMDLLANDLFVERLESRHLLHRIISEEMKDPRIIGKAGDDPLLLAMDPLDGSSNLDVNGILGTVFGIYKDKRDPLPLGRDLCASGYFLYGPSTTLVLTTGQGVNGFTLDRSKGEFKLSHPAIRCPSKGHFLCANVAHFSQWPDAVQAYMDSLIARARLGVEPLSLRYSGAMATDIHRILLEGGIYVYPPDAQHWTGKIRLLYESLPLAYLFEQATGASSNCMQSLLDVPILEPHQQDHTVLGSTLNVNEYVEAVVSAQRRLSA